MRKSHRGMTIYVLDLNIYVSSNSTCTIFNTFRLIIIAICLIVTFLSFYTYNFDINKL